MDLSRISMPTFIMEPRSLLDKLSDSFYHADYITKATTMADPFERIQWVVKWYISGTFYNKRTTHNQQQQRNNPYDAISFACFFYTAFFV